MATDFTTEVTTWYKDIQFRAPPAAELATYSSLLTAGTLTTAQVQADIINSDYTTTYVIPVILEYQAAFNRVPDQAGLSYWVNQFASNPSTGLSQISTIFANSSEFSGLYGGATASTPENSALVSAFYQNVLQRSPDAAGLAYWNAQNLTAGQLLKAFATSAEFATDTANAVNVYLNDELTTPPSEPTTGTLFQLGGGSTFTLTQNADTGTEFTTSATGAVFNALPFVTALGIGNNTLNTGDVLTDTVGDGTLNFTTASGGVGANPALALGVTLTGIKTLNITNLSGGVGGIEGSVTGLTAVNDTGSNNTVKLGSLSAGLSTALTNVNISGFTGGNSSIIIEDFQAASGASAANKLTVAVTGPIGGTAGGAADTFVISNDSGGGTKAAPNIAYGTLNFSFTSTANAQLSSGGASGSVSGTTALGLAGAGNIGIGTDVAGSFQLLTTIDASAATGSVYITGAAAGLPGNAISGPANPGGLFGSATGLLNDPAGTFALTSFKLGSGVDTLDASAASLPEFAALTTVPSASIAATNEIIVSSLVADTTSATTWANIKGFSILGDVGAGGDTGTINMANLPSTINDIFYQTPAAGNLTITNQTAPLTVDTENNGEGSNIVSTGTGLSDSLTLIVGNDTIGVPAGGLGSVGSVTLVSNDTFTIMAQGTSTGIAADSVGFVSLTPSLTGNEHVTISGTENVTIGTTLNGAIADDASPTGALDVNNLTLVVNDTGVVTLHSSTFGGTSGLWVAVTGDTMGPIGNSTNAVSIDAHLSGGLIMEGGDANFTASGTVAGSVGDIITGSATAGNVLGGSIGNDTITGTKSLTAADTIYTGGGTDAITLAAGHTASDAIELYSGFATPGVAPGGTETGRFASVVDATDHAQLGWWGLGTSGAATVPPVSSAGTGVFSDLSKVVGFATGGDHVDISLGSFSSLLSDDIAGVAPTIGAAVFSNDISTGGKVTTGAGTDVLVLGSPFANATTVASSLASAGLAGTFITFGGTQAAGDHHYIIAYQNLAGAVDISDLDIHSTAAFTTTKTGATETLAVSDMVELTGVSLAILQHTNIHFVA